MLAERTDREVVIGCIGRLHDLLDQQFVEIEDANAFRRFQHPDSETHAESFRITRSDANACTLLAEHRTQALGASSRWKFGLYWYGMVDLVQQPAASTAAPGGEAARRTAPRV